MIDVQRGRNQETFTAHDAALFSFVALVASTKTLRQLVVDACIVHNGIASGLGGDFLLKAQRHNDPMMLSISVGSPFSESDSMPMERCAVVVSREMTFELPPGFTGQIRSLFDLRKKRHQLAEPTGCPFEKRIAGIAAAIMGDGRDHNPIHRVFSLCGLKVVP